MKVVEFIATLQHRLSTLFPDAEVAFDGENLTVHFQQADSDRDFVLLVVDLTCMEQDDNGCIAVHARPDHMFADTITVEEDDSRTLVLADSEPFVKGDWINEHEDGHGNTMWAFDFPDDSTRIADLACGLTKIANDYFEGIIVHSSSLNRNIRSVISVIPCAFNWVCVMSIRIISSTESFIDRTSARSPPKCVNGFAGHAIIRRACLRLAPACCAHCPGSG
jgi:hypothetical protein